VAAVAREHRLATRWGLPATAPTTPATGHTARRNTGARARAGQLVGPMGRRRPTPHLLTL